MGLLGRRSGVLPWLLKNKTSGNRICRFKCGDPKAIKSIKLRDGRAIKSIKLGDGSRNSSVHKNLETRKCQVQVVLINIY